MRHLLRRPGARLDGVAGSGAGGRVTKRDILADIANSARDRSGYLSPRVRATLLDTDGRGLPARGTGRGGRITWRDIQGGVGDSTPLASPVGRTSLRGLPVTDGLWISGLQLVALPSDDPAALQRRVALTVLSALRAASSDVLEATFSVAGSNRERLVRITSFADLSAEAILTQLEPEGAEYLVSVICDSVVVELATSSFVQTRGPLTRCRACRFATVARPLRAPVVRVDASGGEALGIGWTVAIAAFATDSVNLPDDVERTLGRLTGTLSAVSLHTSP